MSSHNSLRKSKMPVAVLAALSLSALTGCFNGGEKDAEPRVTTVEQARTDAERRALINNFNALNIVNSPISSETVSNTMSMAEKAKALYDSVKTYIDYANSEEVLLSYYNYSPQTGDATMCELKLDDEQNVSMFVGMNGFGRPTYETYVTITPDHISYSLKIISDEQGTVLNDGEVTDAQFAGVVSTISDAQTSFLEPETYCGKAFDLTEVLTDKFSDQ